MNETTLEEARGIARLCWCTGQVEGIHTQHAYRKPIARRLESGIFEVGYSWCRPESHHLTGRVYERILGRGETWGEAFAEADKRIAASAERARSRRAGA